MKVHVLYFAAAREAAGLKAEELVLPAGATAADALAAACAAHPRLAAIASQLRLAVDQAFAPGTLPLREGAELALIPPVAGGAGPGLPAPHGGAPRAGAAPGRGGR